MLRPPDCGRKVAASITKSARETPSLKVLQKVWAASVGSVGGAWPARDQIKGRSTTKASQQLRAQPTATASTMSSRAARSAGGTDPSSVRPKARPANAKASALGRYVTSMLST